MINEYKMSSVASLGSIDIVLGGREAGLVVFQIQKASTQLWIWSAGQTLACGCSVNFSIGNLGC